LYIANGVNVLIINNKLLKIFICILFFNVQFSQIESKEFPRFSEIKENLLISESMLLDRYGNALHELRTREDERRLPWVSLDEISAQLVNAVILAEDKRFYSHSGVDYLALGSSIIRVFSKDPIRGASTITMQLVPLLQKELYAVGGRKTIYQKWSQILSAKSLESEWTKEEILEAYLNLLTFRGELVGIHSASKGLFQKLPHGLNERESLLLAALIKLPSATADRVAKRVCFIAGLMKSSESCDDLKFYVISKLSTQYNIKSNEEHAYHLAHKLLKKGSVERITTTIDKKIQLFAIETVFKHISKLKNKNVKDASVIVIHNSTGEVLAYVGSSGNLSDSPYIDGVNSKRQAGSTLKPFIYALGLENKLITTISLLEDSPIEIHVGNGIYSPSNYQSKYYGFVPVRIALASSLNIPAVKVLSMVGEEKFNELLEKLGFQDLRESEFYGLSIALGSLDISLKDLTNAYRTFANNGYFSDIYFIPHNERQLSRTRILSKEVSFLISNILSDRVNRSLTFGLENPLSTKFYSAAKTGTSKDMRDNWCIGYTDKVTVGVWVGNFKGDPMWDVTGITGAGPIWSDVIHFVNKIYPSEKIHPPEGLIEKEYVYEDGKKMRKDYFLPDTEPNFIPSLSKKGENQIQSPLNDTVIAIDPEIPNKVQKIFLEPRYFDKKLFWVVDGKKIGNAESIQYIEPKLGNHQINLVDQNDKLIDSVNLLIK
jgi:penicillin-binding protein 1C